MGEGFTRWLKTTTSGPERKVAAKEARRNKPTGPGPVYDGETVEPNVFRAGQDPIKIGGSDVKPRKEVAVSTGKDASVVVKKGVKYAPDVRRKVDRESVQVGGTAVSEGIRKRPAEKEKGEVLACGNHGACRDIPATSSWKDSKTGRQFE